MNTSSLPTRIGRRLFFAFLAVAAVPVVTVSVYALGHFSTTLGYQQQRQLGDAIRAQGHLIMARLDEAITLLGNPDTRIATGVFEQSRILSLDGSGIARPTLETRSDHIVLSLPVDQGVAEGTLNPSWFWQGVVSLPPRVAFCVEAINQGQIIYCGDQEGVNADVPVLVDQLPSDETTYSFKLETPTGSYDVAQWELFLNSRVAGGAWRLTAVRPANDFVEGLALGKFLPSLVALSIAVAALFSLVLLRRRLKPLQELTEATDRVASSNFVQPVEIDQGDEFGELAQGFNQMMRRLNEEISRYRINAEIDRLILQNESAETVLNLILGRAFVFVDADYLAIGVVYGQNESKASVQCTRASDSAVGPIQQARLSDHDLARLKAAKRPSVLADEWSAADCIYQMGGRHGLLLGIHWRSRLLGFVIAGVSLERTDDLSLRNQMVELRDRIAITLTTAEKEKTLFRQANFDSLTGLPNRHLFQDRLRLSCDDTEGTREPFALAFIDLDNFKLVNDSLGHAGGDQLLIEVARRLKNCALRGDTVARLGGDEFVIILNGCSDPGEASSRARAITEAFQAPVAIEEQSAQVNASVGIAMCPADGETPGELLRNADAAMYRAKELGRNRIIFFTDDINQDITRRFQVLNRLQQALKDNSLALAYQPQMNLTDHAFCGVEVLVRWPDSGVSPAELIDVAEEYGVIAEVGRWVLSQACKDISGMPDAIRPGRFSVNVSARQLTDPGFADFVTSCLNSAGLPSHILELEITESLLVADSEEVMRQLDVLKSSGIGLALDDFGTGYSSLTYLQQIPVDVVKIDRSFVRHVDTNSRQQGFVGAVVNLAHTIGKKTIAEGAETQSEVERLIELGCDALQGYVYSKPLPGITGLSQFLEKLRLDNAPAPASNSPRAAKQGLQKAV